MSYEQNELRRSRRLATIIPASYWMNIGCSDEVAHSMDYLQNDMKKYGDGDMGNDPTEIKLIPKDNQGNSQIDLGSDCILPHHDIMLPHWKKLTKAFNGTLYIMNISLPRPVLETILPSLHRLKSLALLRVNLMNDGYECLSSFLERNSSLEGLFIADTIDDISVATSFSCALRITPSSTFLCLSGVALTTLLFLR